MSTFPAPPAPDPAAPPEAEGPSVAAAAPAGASPRPGPVAGKSRRKTAPRPSGGMRMAELALRSGVSRETIHFYLREGLLPRPRKGGRTVAYYDEEHLSRLTLIRTLREEKYLPL